MGTKYEVPGTKYIESFTAFWYLFNLIFYLNRVIFPFAKLVKFLSAPLCVFAVNSLTKRTSKLSSFRGSPDIKRLRLKLSFFFRGFGEHFF